MHDINTLSCAVSYVFQMISAHDEGEGRVNSASLRIAVIEESAFGETRVAATPETVRKLTALGAQLVVEQGAGACRR